MFPTPGVESIPQRIKAGLKAKWGPTFYEHGAPHNVAGECVLTVSIL